MEKLLNNFHYGVISLFNAIWVIEKTSRVIHPIPKLILDKSQNVFEIPIDLPPSRGEHDYKIPLLLGIQPPNVRAYKYPFSQKNEIENSLHELMEVGLIHPRTSPYYSPVVMVLKKEGTWHMGPDFCAMNKLTIKDKFPILVVDDLLDELQGSFVFTKLDLGSSYHQI
jgi:hypothetical protein